jgi:hypothetical protein
MMHEDRNDEPKLVAATKLAFQNVPDVKIPRAFEMRRNVANKALRTKGWCDGEGKGGGTGVNILSVHSGDAVLPPRPAGDKEGGEAGANFTDWLAGKW